MLLKYKTNFLKVQKTARYVTYGTLNAETKYLWICLHGSNMLCEQILYKFRAFDPQTHFIISAEGLNRFYAKGMQGDVVASWMTSRDRLMEIEDFSEYLSQLLHKYSTQVPATCKKIILGFSQGGTTAFRWLHAKKEPVDHIIAYSCWVPEDIDLSQSKTDLSTIDLMYTYGLQDIYLSEERMNVLRSIVEKNNLIFPIHSYEGGHKIDRKQLKLLFETYIHSPKGK